MKPSLIYATVSSAIALSLLPCGPAAWAQTPQGADPAARDTPLPTLPIPDHPLLARLPDLASPATTTTRIYWENDGSFADPLDSYDRDYTNGFAVTIDHQPIWAQQLLDYMPFADTFSQNHGRPNTAAGYVLGQLIFTPREISQFAPIPGDRPFAGYLYGGAYWQRQADYQRREDASVFDHFEINLGVVGDSSLAEDIQTFVHDHFAGATPNGWDNQLRDEFAYQFYYRRKWRFDTGGATLPFLGDVQTQLIPTAGLAVGSVYRYAEASLTARLGFQLPDDFGAGRINDLASATGRTLDPDTAPHGWAWYAWLRVGGRYVEHNTFLDGSNTQNPSPSVRRNPFVGEAQTGLSVSYHDGPYTAQLTWGVTFLTNEFELGPAAPTSNASDGTNSYGTVTLSLTKRF